MFVQSMAKTEMTTGLKVKASILEGCTPPAANAPPIEAKVTVAASKRGMTRMVRSLAGPLTTP